MKNFILIGLGNPGEKYEHTRHNVGKMFVRYLQKYLIEGLEAIEAESFMNESGQFVYRVYSNYKNNNHYRNLFICHDDLDLRLGNFKIQFGKGPKQHNGVLSVEKALRTKEFWRIRIGIDARRNERSGEDYVLSDFSREQWDMLKTEVFPEVKKELENKCIL